MTTQAFAEPAVWPLQSIAIGGKVMPVYQVWNPIILEFIVGPYRTLLESTGWFRLIDRKGKTPANMRFTRLRINAAKKLEVVQ